MREDHLRFRATPKQCWGSIAGTVVLAAVAVGLAALAHWRFGLQTPIEGWDISATAVFLMLLWISICLPFAYTELSPSGIRARGFAGSRRCSWPEITAIGVSNYRRGVRTIVVTRHDHFRLFRRSRFRLAVPVNRPPLASDEDFASKYSAIWYYWQEAAAASGLK